ncbi:MAG TPA: FAD/NAD(P)-binding protein, partial [Anaerolineales bacterium]|nr:FAD/NAD(P)-binding protein [Anaerolineales bacterium]
MTPAATPSRIADNVERTLLPQWAEVVTVHQELSDVSTLALRFVDPSVHKNYRFKPGQFNMLYLPGFGEAAISISSDPEDGSQIGHTVRFVGNVTRALGRVRPGEQIGVRGPFGSAWPIDSLRGQDIFIACGGIGLPPLRPVISQIVRHRDDFGKVTLLYGARTPADLMYTKEYEDWQRAGIQVETTVDRADTDWAGRVGVVPMWFYHFRIDPHNTAVLTCGPEIMIRFVIFEALARRIAPENIFVSLERNMKCGQGSCGHCQI